MPGSRRAQNIETMMNYILLGLMFIIGGGGICCIGFALFGKAKKGEESKPFLEQKIS